MGRKKIPHDRWKVIGKEVISYLGSHGTDVPPERMIVEYDEETPTASIQKTPGGNYRILLSPELSKKQVSSYLKHELTHLDKGHLAKSVFTSEEEPSSIKAHNELVALRGEGHVNPIEVCDIALGLVDTWDVSPGEAWSIVSSEALSLGFSREVVRRAKSWFWTCQGESKFEEEII